MAVLSEQQKLPAPDWLHKHPSDWPPEARAAWSILARGAERRLKAEAAATWTSDGNDAA